MPPAVFEVKAQGPVQVRSPQGKSIPVETMQCLPVGKTEGIVVAEAGENHMRVEMFAQPVDGAGTAAVVGKLQEGHGANRRGPQ